MPTTPLELYWLHVGIAVLGILACVSLYKEWEDKNYKKLVVLAALFVGGLGMIFLGRAPKAATTNIHLEGKVQADVRALEVELRNQEDLVFQTRQELETSRKENQKLKEQLAQKKFEEDLRAGRKRMTEAREEIMDRNRGE